MIYINRVIGRLMKLMEYPYLTSSLCCSRENSLSEIVFRHHLRATEREKDTSRFDFLEAFDVQSRVTTQSVLQRFAVFSKGRRVLNDEIILTIMVVKILKSIVTDSLMA